MEKKEAMQKLTNMIMTLEKMPKSKERDKVIHGLKGKKTCMQPYESSERLSGLLIKEAQVKYDKCMMEVE